MDLGHCPRCATPYSASEVSGFGVLRGRSAQKGGPRVEYTCPSCGRLIQLVAHGEGRYAPPGQPPPAAVAVEERAPPWIRGGGGPRQTGPHQTGPAESTASETEDEGRDAVAPEAEPPPSAAPPPRPAAEALAPAADTPIAPLEALALLGVEAGADQAAIERAFRERSLACHPDKVAHLDPDFLALAERKFLRLRQAYELLRP